MIKTEKLFRALPFDSPYTNNSSLYIPCDRHRIKQWSFAVSSLSGQGLAIFTRIWKVFNFQGTIGIRPF